VLDLGFLGVGGNLVGILHWFPGRNLMAQPYMRAFFFSADKSRCGYIGGSVYLFLVAIMVWALVQDCYGWENESERIWTTLV